MPSVAGNGGDFSASEDTTSAAASALHRRMSGSGVGAFSGGSGGSGPSSGSASPLNAAPLVSSMDAWLVQKLKNEWSSCDLGPLLTKERVSEAVASFPHLDTPVKVRLLLSFLSMKREDFDESKFAVVEIVDAAEKDSEEWVKVGAGIVNQYLFMSRDGAESGTFLHDKLAAASTAVLDAVAARGTNGRAAPPHHRVIIEDFFCHENAFLSASVRPELAVQPAAHFTIAENAPANGSNRHGGHASGGSSSSSSTVGASVGGTAASGAAAAKHKLPPPHYRPQLSRPLAHSSVTAATASSSSSAVPSRMATLAAKPLPPLKKNMSELSSEIRRKADAGRFKRQRSRISVIDIDEVKQIESEKALKAEEQKKKLKATKDDKKGSGGGGNSAAAGGAGGVAGDATASGDSGDKTSGGIGAHDGGDEEGAHDGQTQDSQYSDQHDEQHDSDRDDAAEPGYRGSASASGSAAYAQDGTQALLHAAFHSTGDVMKEVVAQQQHQQQQPYPQHDYYGRASQQQQQQSLYSSRGFEPEDAYGGGGGAYGGGSNAYGYGAAGGYGGSHFADQGAPYGDTSQYAVPGGFEDDQAVQQQQQQQGRYDSNRDRGGYLDGPPDHWR